MTSTDGIVKNERGSIIIVALMILALLTVIGIAATRTSNTEVQVAGNEYVYQRNFYLAEGAALEAVDLLEQNPNLAAGPPTWLEPVNGGIQKDNLNQYWQDKMGVSPAASTCDPGHARLLAGAEGIAPGSSLGLGHSRVHLYSVYGRCENKGVTTIRIGYLKAF